MQQGQRRKVDKNPSVTPTIINVGQKGMRETKASKWQYIGQSLANGIQTSEERI